MTTETKQIIMPDGNAWHPGYIRKLDKFDQIHVKRCVKEFLAHAKRQHKRRSRPAPIEAPKEFVPDESETITVTTVDGSIRCRQILELLAESPKTVGEIVKILGLGDNSVVNRNLKRNPELFQRNGEKWTGTNNAIVWELTDAGRLELAQPSTMQATNNSKLKGQLASAAKKSENADRTFLEWLAANQPSTQSQMAIGLRLNKRSITARLSKLMADGSVRLTKSEPIGASRSLSNFYEVVKEK